MKSLNQKIKLVIIIGGLILLLVVIGGYFLVIPKTAKIEVQDTTKECNSLELGNEIESVSYQICKENSNYYQFISSTYQKDTLILYRNVVKEEEGYFYNIDHVLLGNSLEDAIESGSTYVYTFKKENNKYKLIKIELL